MTLTRSPLRRDDGKARLSVPAPRTKRCAKAKGGCGEPFLACRPLQAACSPQCAMVMAIAKRQKVERKADQQKREKMLTAKEWRPLAQAAFNAYIRLRDAGLPCICCGKPMEPDKPGGAVDAGHFRSVGSAAHLRFDERNCHAQRKNCNRPGGTTHAAYRAGLIERIGLDAVGELEADQDPRKFTADDLKSIRDTYRAKARELKKARAE